MTITRSSYTVLDVEEESEDEEEKQEEDESVLDVSDKVTSKVQEISPEETKEKSLFESLKSQIEQLKLSASEKHQKGLYDDAIHIYNKALKAIQDQESSFKFLSTSILLLKTALWNNIALCYKQLQNTDGELEFCSRVIDH